MSNKKPAKKPSALQRIEANIATLIENDRFVIRQFELLQDEIAAVRSDVVEIKSDVAQIHLRTFDLDSDLKALKRFATDEPVKRHDLEHRVRQVLPDLPNAAHS